MKLLAVLSLQTALVLASSSSPSSDIAIIPRDGSQPFAKKADGEIRAFHAMPNGDLYFGGRFSAVDDNANTDQTSSLSAYSIKAGTFTNFPPSSAAIGSQINTLISANDGVYVGSAGGLVQWRQGEWKELPLGGVNGNVQSILPLNESLLLIAGQFTGSGDDGSRSPSRINPSQFSVFVDQSLNDERGIVCGTRASVSVNSLLTVKLKRMSVVTQVLISATGLLSIQLKSPQSLAYPNGTVCQNECLALSSAGYQRYLIINQQPIDTLTFSLKSSLNSVQLHHLQLFQQGMEYEFQESSEQCSASQSARITAIQQSNETVITLSPSGFSKGFYQVSLVFPVACNNTNNSTCQSPQLNSAVGVELKYSPSLPSLTLQLDSQSLVTGQPVLLYNGQIENVVSLTLRSQSSAVSQSTVRFIKSPTVQSLNGLAVLDLQSNSLRPLVGQEIVQMVKVSESKLLIIGRPRIGMLFNLQSGQPELLPNGGLNGEINAVVRVDNLIYIGGQFTATADQTLQLPNNIAILSVNSTNSTLQWLPFPVSEFPLKSSLVRNIRHDRVSNTLHIFSNTFNSSATNYLVYDVQSQSIRLPDQEFYLTATDVSFDEQFIYASGKFDQLPTENTVLLLSRRLKPWMIALIVLLSLLVVGIIAWLFIRLRRQRQEKESKKLYYPDEISGSQLSIDNEISTWTLPHNNFNSQPMIAENLLLHDTRVPLTVLATESSSIYSISDMISQELHDDTHNDHDDNTQATLASHTSHASHSHNSHNSNEVISDEQKVMTNTSSYISYASQGSQEAPQISPVSETSSLSECLMVVPNNNPTIAQTTTESSGLTETAFTASEGTLSTVALNRALTDENSDELKDKHTNDESNMTQFKVGQLLRVNTDWGQMKGDLRVKSGDVVRVLEHSDLEWVYGELVNSDEEEKPEGILPANICSISHQ